MSSWRILRNAANDDMVLARVKLCASIWCHFKGLMLTSNLPETEGLLFVTGQESRVNTTIHMFFMLMPIGVVWLDSSGRVVDKQLAKPWRPAYAPQAPARYYLEANVSILDRVQVGDVLRFDEITN
ncbi:MAG: DUF192 domain-containing protein [Anaerolineae bacterium]|nr:DUF192 domain-containing protein [Anaerolineae bacterium]